MHKTLFSIFPFRSFIPRTVNTLFSTAIIFALITFHSHMVFAQKIVLVAAVHSIPTSYIENGQQTGILIDIVNEAFARSGHPIEIKLMPWRAVYGR